MNIWVSFRCRTDSNIKTLATLKMPAELVPQMGDQVGIDHTPYMITERVHPNISSHEEELPLDPDVVHLWLGVEPIKDGTRSFDPNVLIYT